MSLAEKPGRPNQKQRTRKDLLDAAARLMKQGRKAGLEEIAEEALVSRATAYRYFPSVEALLLEAALHVALPTPAELFADGPPADPVARLDRVEAAMHEMMAANEAPLRMMLANTLQAGLKGDAAPDLPARQNRRTPLIEAALAPARGEFDPKALELLGPALALIIGTEAMVVFKDVLRLDDRQSRKVTRWAIRALVAAARAS
ncbi:TetR/AcrR family transcriptional regulator [Phenylobacterium sp.]|uniref:TetR/AcrR family transcriptional regulator n=1 Tax=Phenylobacterium sp. TaxID=1871053 RepID=UPI002FCAB4C1